MDIITFYQQTNKEKFIRDITKNCVVHKKFIKIIFASSEQGILTNYAYHKLIEYLLSFKQLKSKYPNMYYICEKTYENNMYVKFAILYMIINTIIDKNDLPEKVDSIFDTKYSFYNNEICDILEKENDKYMTIIRKIKGNHKFSLFDMVYNDLLKQIIMDLIKEINDILKPLCDCCRNINNDKTNVYYNIELDMIERYVYETDITNFNFFMEIDKKISKYLNERPYTDRSIIYISGYTNHKILDIASISEDLKRYSLDVFQKTGSKQLFIYNRTFVTYNEIADHRLQNIKTETIDLPPYCFVCEKTNIVTKIELGTEGYNIIGQIVPVDDFACNDCKRKLIKQLSLEQKDKIIRYPEQKFIHGCIKNRRYMPLIIIKAWLFDLGSLFSMLNSDVIYSIIFSIYWTIYHIENNCMMKNRMILYSKYRGIL